MAQDKFGEGRVGRGLTDHVYVDVDGTLLIWRRKPGGASDEEVANVDAYLAGAPHDPQLLPRVNLELRERLIAWAEERRRHEADPRIVIWSMGGERHAYRAKQFAGLNFSFVATTAKPDIIIDDAKHDKLFARIRAVIPEEFIRG